MKTSKPLLTGEFQMRIRLITACIGLCACLAMAQDVAKVGINVTTNAFSLNNSNYGEKGLRNVGMLGGRYFITPRIGIDGSIGFGYNSPVNADTSALTTKDPGITNVSGQLGIFYKLTPPAWKSYLGLVANGGVSYQKWYDALNLRDTTRVLPALPAKNYVTYSLVEPYSVYIPYFFVGLEPGFAFDNHFSLFVNFGINGIFYPNSKAIDQRTLSTYNTYVTSHSLIERNDASFELSVSSIGLGVRFLF